MISFIKETATALFGRGHERTLKIKKNIIISFFVKGGSMLIGFLLLPVTLHYVDPLQYGVWLTISSVVAWMNNFDIGLSNGLRNKLAEAYARGDYAAMRKYISTTYAALFVIAALTFAIFALLVPYFNWNRLLNVPLTTLNNLQALLLVVLSCFCVQFILQPINTILTATHELYKVSGITFLGQLISLIAVYLMSVYTKSNLLNLVLVLAGVPVVVLLLSNIILFSTTHKNLTPGLKHVDVKSARSLLGVGGTFFFLQMASLIIYQTDNVIIIRVDPTAGEAVTRFNIAYRLFTFLVMVAVIIMAPYWSAFTDAYTKNELAWIKNALKRLRQAWFLLTLTAAVFFFCSNTIYRLWIGPGMVIETSVSLSMAVYVSVYMFQLIYTYFLNGTGKTRLQLIVVFISAVVNIPLCIYWGRVYGLAGIVNANTAVTVVMNIIFYIQSRKILGRTATGIWNK